MDFEWDEPKRRETLANRDLDFADAAKVFAGRHLTIMDDRADYGEARFQTYGRLDGNIVMLVWTQRGGARRVISMRKCNDREREKVERALE